MDICSVAFEAEVGELYSWRVYCLIRGTEPSLWQCDQAVWCLWPTGQIYKLGVEDSLRNVSLSLKEAKKLISTTSNFFYQDQMGRWHHFAKITHATVLKTIADIISAFCYRLLIATVIILEHGFKERVALIKVWSIHISHSFAFKVLFANFGELSKGSNSLNCWSPP
jgi:hypothetical protein